MLAPEAGGAARAADRHRPDARARDRTDDRADDPPRAGDGLTPAPAPVPQEVRASSPSRSRSRSWLSWSALRS
ncbi:MAG TPA: hypothetical protein DCS55_05990 [Acidimicrobiaceae bacterium]|nr:hypothetical protein [Acidimicrobiaceae bacterium]